MKKPYLFDDFFASGMEESISPFLTKDSRAYAKNLSLKSALLASFFLAISYCFSFYFPSLSHLFLAFVYFLAGIPSLIDALEDLKNFEIHIDLLMTFAAFSALFLGSGFEGALLLVLFELSHGLEESVMKKAKTTLLSLQKISPRSVKLVLKDGSYVERSIRDVQVKDHLLVPVGEIIPLDGKIISGSSFVDLQQITGEFLPLFKNPGDVVVAGSRNIEAMLVIEVARVSHDSTLTQLMKLISSASDQKPKLEKAIDRITKTYSSLIILTTFLLAIFLPLFFHEIAYLGKEGSIYRSLAFLIAASPCALILSAPIAYLSAISSAAKKGILFKTKEVLDQIAKCKMVAFDKTGTLTEGKLDLQEIYSLHQEGALITKEELSIAYGLELHSTHPIAHAIINLAKKEKLEPTSVHQFRLIPGIGLEGSYQGKSVFIGHPEKALSFPLFFEVMEKCKGKVLAVLIIQEKAYLFSFEDRLRKEIAQSIDQIRQKKIKTVMLTGDFEHNAKKIANFLGIEEVYAGLLPEQKLSLVETLSKKEHLIMIGDGINDAAALKRASVGICMGKIGSRLAIDASDVVFLNDDLHHLPWLLDKGKETIQIIRQNLTLSLSFILIATIPSLLGLIPLWLAVILHEGGTLLVGLNSLRLLKK